ncbi:hypothetical protein EYF80_046849 [Liparis tanakae]|uniref:Uncharacterized protein n=1 Tax=Liparis tanakae TaxID=230148 RepID=A0A4Z2FP97_9TELE|nr:hypothetical protein EYF80_046849 [Liparis tanakae]
MESGPLGMDTNIAPGPRVQSNCSLAFLRRQAWAQSKDSTWQESEAESGGPEGPQKSQGDGGAPRPSEEPDRAHGAVETKKEGKEPEGSDRGRKERQKRKSQQREGFPPLCQYRYRGGARRSPAVARDHVTLRRSAPTCPL